MLAPRTNPHRVGRQPPPGRHTRNTPIYLALYQAQRPFDDVASEYDIRNEQERAVLRQEYESTDALYARWKHDPLVAVPTARVVDLVGANVYMCASKQDDVLREIRSFVATWLRP